MAEPAAHEHIAETDEFQQAMNLVLEMAEKCHKIECGKLPHECEQCPGRRLIKAFEHIAASFHAVAGEFAGILVVGTLAKGAAEYDQMWVEAPTGPEWENQEG